MKKNFQFKTEWQATFSDCDPQGIVYFSQFFDWAHKTIEFFLMDQSLYTDWFMSEIYAVPLKKADCEYSAPIQFGESTEAHLRVEKLGTSSLTFLVQFIKKKEDIESSKANPSSLAAEVRTTHVFVKRSDFKPCPMPDHLKTFLQDCS